MNFIEIKNKYDRHGEKLETEQTIIINVDFIASIEKYTEDDIDFNDLSNDVISKKLFIVDICCSCKVISIYFPSLKERDECYDNLVKRIKDENWIQEMEEKNRENEMEEITRQIIERGQIFKDVIERGQPDKLRS